MVSSDCASARLIRCRNRRGYLIVMNKIEGVVKKDLASRIKAKKQKSSG
jgi:hypothetical protein